MQSLARFALRRETTDLDQRVGDELLRPKCFWRRKR